MTLALAISTPGHVHPEGSIGTSLLWTPPWPDELVKGLICCCSSPRPVPIGDISGHAAYEDGRTPHYPPRLWLLVIHPLPGEQPNIPIRPSETAFNGLLQTVENVFLKMGTVRPLNKMLFGWEQFRDFSQCSINEITPTSLYAGYSTFFFCFCIIYDVIQSCFFACCFREIHSAQMDGMLDGETSPGFCFLGEKPKVILAKKEKQKKNMQGIKY